MHKRIEDLLSNPRVLIFFFPFFAFFLHASQTDQASEGKLPVIMQISAIHDILEPMPNHVSCPVMFHAVLRSKLFNDVGS